MTKSTKSDNLLTDLLTLFPGGKMIEQTAGIEEIARKRKSLLQIITLLEPVFREKKLTREGTGAMNRELYAVIRLAIPKERRTKHVLDSIPAIIPKYTKKLCTAVVVDAKNISEEYLDQIKKIICSFALRAEKRSASRKNIKPRGEKYHRGKSGRTRRVA